MKLILTGGAVIGAVSAIAYAQSDVIADAFVSGDWAKIAGGLMLLIFAGAAWVVKTQRADIHRLRARLDAQIERDFERETRTLETIHKITSALNALNRSHTQLAKSVNEIEQQLNAGDSKAR